MDNSIHANWNSSRKLSRRRVNGTQRAETSFLVFQRRTRSKRSGGLDLPNLRSRTLSSPSIGISGLTPMMMKMRVPINNLEETSILVKCKTLWEDKVEEPVPEEWTWPLCNK